MLARNIAEQSDGQLVMIQMKGKQIENHMVVDSYWESMEKNSVEEVLTSTGYHKVGTNEFVPDSEAYGYALDQCLNGSEEDVKEFKAMLVDWYYSGGAWRREEQDVKAI